MIDRAYRLAARTDARLVPVLVGLLLLAALAQRPALSQRADGWIELDIARTDATSQAQGGDLTESRTRTFQQRYSLDAAWQLYPNLRLNAGGLFEVDSVEPDNGPSSEDLRAERWRPFVNLLLRTPIFSVDLGFFLDDESRSIAGRESGDTRETYSAVASWRPVGLPRFRLRMQRENAYDLRREFLDTTEDLIELSVKHSLYDRVTLEYRGSTGRFEDRLRSDDTRRNSHFGKATYGDSWFGGRTQFSAEYNLSRRTTEFLNTGIGEIFDPLFPLAGLALITDLPEDATLASAPGLIDGNLAASAGINIGFPAVGDDDRPRNFGLDFGGPVAVDALRVWISRDLPLQVANFFRWEVYTSDDNVLWTLRRTVEPGDFGPVQNRFELRFQELSARFIKVVVRPLDLSVPGADEFSDIFITELEAFDRLPPGSSGSETTRRASVFSSSLRTTLIDGRQLYHELSYFTRTSDNGPVTYSLFNGLSYAERFSRVYSLSSRISREDSRETAGDRVSYRLSSSLRIEPIPTLQHSVVFSSRTSELRGQKSEVNSVFFYSSARLYTGINASLNVGRTFTLAEDDRKTDATQVNATAQLTPHETLTLNLLHQRSKSDTTGNQAIEARSLDRRASEASASFRPLSSIYSFFSYRLEQDDGLEDRIVRNFSVGWSPFPDGSLQISANYDETFRTELDALTRLTGASVRWNVTERWYVQTGYQRTRFDNELSSRDAESIFFNTRLIF